MTEPQYARPEGAGAWLLTVWVQPGARKSEVDGVHDGRLRIRLQAPAVENKANKALAAFVAELFKIRKNRVTLVQGEKSRAKTLRIESETTPLWPA
ncbi:DUF167 domain-containing protein [Desulfocurvus sp. DL9XJH121]